MVSYLQRNNYRIILISIILLISIWGMYLRFEYRAKHYLWSDEVTQISQMGSLSSAFKQSLELAQLPGDHLLIYPFYHFFGKNKWGLAIPHIIIAISGFYLLFLLCRKYFKTAWGYIITFSIFATNYTIIRHAFEIRPYGVLAVLNIANFLIMQYICEKEQPSLIKRSFVSAFIFISILFHTFGIFILFFCYIYHLLFSRRGVTLREVLLRHLKQYGIALAITLPLWYYLATRNADVSRFQLDVFEWCGRGVIAVFKSVFGNLTGRRIFYLLLPGIIINYLLPHKDRFKQMMFFLVIIILPISIVFLECLYNKYWFIQRLYTWAIPLFTFLIGWSWDSIIVYFKKFNLANKVVKL